MKLEEKIDNDVRDLYKELEIHKPKLKINLWGSIKLYVKFLINFLPYTILVLLLVVLMLIAGVYVGIDNSGSNIISMAALTLSFIGLYDNVVMCDNNKRYIYYYSFSMIDSLNEFSNKLYNNKLYSDKIVIDKVECVDIKGKIYLKITYH